MPTTADSSRWQCIATMCHYYKQLMITPLLAALITLLCFVIRPGWVSTP